MSPAQHLQLVQNAPKRTMKHGTPVIICGLGFGDERKGGTADALARRFGPSVVVRYNGGPQAGHNVVTPSGVWHCFAQFGAGSLAPYTRSVLARHMLIDLDSMATEADMLGKKIRGDAWSLQTIDPDCRIITPMQKLVGRMREVARGKKPNGSCGMGVGETIADDDAGLSVRVRDITNGDVGKKKIRRIAEVKLAEGSAILISSRSAELAALWKQLQERCENQDALFYNYTFKLERVKIERAAETIRQALARGKMIILEGAQGALLDRTRGFVPHITKSDTTCKHAVDLVREAGFTEPPFKLGIMRAYGHRHGAGPFVSEDKATRNRFVDQYNPENRWQGSFRVGWLDLPALRYGIHMNGGVDGLAVSCLDQLSNLPHIHVCSGYRTPDGRAITDLSQERISAAERTVLVSECRPIWMEWPGWTEDLTKVRRFEELPENAKTFLRFLESDAGLATPVVIGSVGPTYTQTLFL